MLTKVGVVKRLLLFEFVISVHVVPICACVILTNAADSVFIYIYYIVELSILLACLSELHPQRFGFSGGAKVSMA